MRVMNRKSKTVEFPKKKKKESSRMYGNANDGDKPIVKNDNVVYPNQRPKFTEARITWHK